MIGMGFYAYRLLNRQESTPATPAASAPVSGPQQRAVMMLASGESGNLEIREVLSPLPEDSSLRAQELIRLLLNAYSGPNSRHPLPGAAEVRQVFLLQDGTAVLDMNAAFADQHPSDAKTEQLTVESMVQTLCRNLPQIKRVRILVEGQERETLAGHLDLRKPFPAR
ncbi:MAG: GerMN domain-containing protein [Candidatus Korobacteraceae bacterium]